MNDMVNALRKDVRDFVKRRKTAVESADPIFLELQKQAAVFVNRPTSVADNPLAKEASRFQSRRDTTRTIGFFFFDVREPGKKTYSEEEVVYCWARDFLGRKDYEKCVRSGLARDYFQRVLAEKLKEIDAWIPVRWYSPEGIA